MMMVSTTGLVHSPALLKASLSVSLSVTIIERKWILVQPCHIAHLLVGLSGGCTVAKWLIEYGCCLWCWMGSVEDGCIRCRSASPMVMRNYQGFFTLIGFSGVFECIFVFDSCVKSWQYFWTDSISVEMSVHWLSEVLLVSRSKLGFTRILQNCYSDFMRKLCLAATFT